MADSLVFDFPDPTPHFDFDNFSNGGGSAGGLSHNSGGSPIAVTTTTSSSSSAKKTSSKKSRALFKSRFMNKGNSNRNSNTSNQQQRPASPVPARSSSSQHHHGNNGGGDDSPLNKSMGDQSGTTATTASLSVEGSGSFSPNRLKYGHSNHSSNKQRAGSTSPKPSSATSAMAPPPNNTNTGKESPRFEFGLFDDTSPSKGHSSGMRKSLLSNKPNPYSNLTSTTATSNNNSTNTHTQQQQNTSAGENTNNLYTTYGLSSDRTAASGYISEVSEFSFDRVTVNTERTGMSSNVSWNFLDNGGSSPHPLGSRSGSGGDGVLGALGSGGGTNGGGGSSKLAPPDIENLLLDDALLQQQQQQNGSHHHHHHHHGHSNNGHRMNVFTGEIHQSSDQSVISEISEGIDGIDDGITGGAGGGAGTNSGMDFINSILMEKYEGAGKVGNQHHQQQYDGKGQQQQQLTSTATPLRKQSSNNNNTISTVGTSGGDFTSIGSTHANEKYIQQRSNNNNSSTHQTNKTEQPRSIFKAIIEDIQFCGMYFCGLDTTVEDDGQLTDNKRDLLHGSPSKEARKKEMDRTFLGKFVNCARNF